MWNDLTIGNGDSGLDAKRISEIEGNNSIYQSETSFWITDLIMDTSIIIFKDTELGQQLQTLINAKFPIENLLHFLNTSILKVMEPDVLLDKINSSIEGAFKKGRKSLAEEIQNIIDADIE